MDVCFMLDLRVEHGIKRIYYCVYDLLYEEGGGVGGVVFVL